MLRTLSRLVVLALCLSLTPAVAASHKGKGAHSKSAQKNAGHVKSRAKAARTSASKHKTRITVRRKHRYGVLPGFGPGDVFSGQRIYGERYGAGGYTLPPLHTWNGGRYYYGRPGFAGGRWNGGSFGPCYMQTPIGPVWNCGQ